MKTVMMAGNNAGIDAVLQSDRHTHIVIDRTCIIGLSIDGTRTMYMRGFEQVFGQHLRPKFGTDDTLGHVTH